MKQIKIFLIALMALTFVACGNKKVEGDFYQSLDQTTEAAVKNNKDILIVFTMEGDDAYSSQFVSSVMNTADFKNDVCSKYEVLRIDFGQSTYEKTIVKEDADKKAQEAAEAFADLMQENSKLANLLNVKATPSFYILSKQQYFIATLDYAAEITSTAQFNELLAVAQPTIDDIHAYIKTIETGSDKEKLAAIDTFYDSTDATYRPFLYPLIIQYMKLDKNDETGLLGKYTLARADMDAVNLYAEGEALKAAQKYADVAEDKALTADQKQQAYYMAAYLLTIGGSPDYQPIMRYLKKALDVAPESNAVPHIQQIYDSFVQMVELTPPNE